MPFQYLHAIHKESQVQMIRMSTVPLIWDRFVNYNSNILGFASPRSPVLGSPFIRATAVTFYKLANLYDMEKMADIVSFISTCIHICIQLSNIEAFISTVFLGCFTACITAASSLSEKDFAMGPRDKRPLFHYQKYFGSENTPQTSPCPQNGQFYFPRIILSTSTFMNLQAFFQLRGIKV